MKIEKLKFSREAKRNIRLSNQEIKEGKTISLGKIKKKYL
jgi:hypothetical protein